MRCGIYDARFVVLCAISSALTGQGCALTSKAALVDVRYFSPECVQPRVDGPVQQPGSEGSPRLRLGRVSSGPNLRERMAHRDAPYELGYYDDLRWTELPETYVRRELGRSLFEAHRLRRVLSGAAPTLDVELIAFDDVHLQTGRAARVELRIILYETDGAIFEETIAIDRLVAGERPAVEDVVAAMSIALDAAADRVTTRVETALAARQSSEGR